MDSMDVDEDKGKSEGEMDETGIISDRVTMLVEGEDFFFFFFFFFVGVESESALLKISCCLMM